MTDARQRELAERLTLVKDRIARSAEHVGRAPEDVSLVVVTKTWPSDDVRRLCDLGVTDFGENRVQEAESKAAQLTDLPISWHFIGQIQSNKAPRVAGFAAFVHSVDSVKVATRLGSGAERGNRSVRCLVQLNLDPVDRAAGRGGASSASIDEVASAVEAAPALRLAGVMGVAPLGADPAEAYRRLAAAAKRLRAVHPHARLVSAGMSGDFEVAIEAGATHVRVGSAVLGERPPNR
jgi:pyridoxal phosphate enzyme (YggS family)